MTQNIPQLKSKNHQLTIDYLVLVAILLAGFLGFLASGFQRHLRLTWIIATAIAYIVWGIIHHLRSGDLHWEIAIEYLLMATLATAMVSTLLL
jgi:hypothetical protein